MRRSLLSEVLEPGWRSLEVAMGKCDEQHFNFRCLTRRVPSARARNQPKGLATASEATKARWAADMYSQSPYQFAASNLVVPAQGRPQEQRGRRLIVTEEERLTGVETR